MSIGKPSSGTAAAVFSGISAAVLSFMLPVSLIITLAAVDADSHLELISELADILMEETHVERLSSCTTEREFVELLRRMKEESNAYYI